MKKRVVMLLAISMVASLLAGCGSTSTDAPTEAPTEAPHEHAYTEAVTLEATCTADGEKTFTCECGDSYKETITALGHAYVEDETTKVEATCEVDGKASDKKCSVCGDVVTGEVVTATGHIFGAYTSNNDATYTADGTETAKCNNCDATDTRVVKGSMLTYSYTDMNATMYAQKSVNVRSLPSADGKKLGGLSTNDEVKVTGQCTETSWYRIEYNGQVGYVSNNYLGKDKVVVKEQPANNGQTTSVTLNSYREAAEYAISLGYPIGQAVDNGDGTAYMYWIGNTVLPYSEETNAQFEVYLDSARKSADSLFGQGTNYYFNDLYDGKVIKQLGNGYTVYRETYKPRPDLGFPRK